MIITHKVKILFYFESIKELPKNIPIHRYDFYSLIFDGARRYYRLELLIQHFQSYQNHIVIGKPGFGAKVGLVGFNEMELEIVQKIDDLMKWN